MNFSILAAALSASESYKQMKSSLILLVIIFAVLLISSIVFTLLALQINCSRSQWNAQRMILIVMYACTILVLVCTLVCFFRYNSVGNQLMAGKPTDPTSVISPSGGNSDTTTPTTSTNTQTTTPTQSTKPSLNPAQSSSSNPANWGVKWEIMENGSIVNSVPSTGISFGDPEDYFALPGISTFRGNNYRDGASYGTATVTEKKLSVEWNKNIGALNGWTGSGWTGQPLVVQWDQETKNQMNLYADKKAKANLVEVIHATLDGKIYFYDLDDGSYTRDPINIGMPFKGAGSLDPRGYPLMYVGSGISAGGKAPRMYVISLIDSSILYEQNGNDTFAHRDWTAFDSSPLVDKETDTLIWPGENGVLYTIKLNTQYDKTNGTIKVSPEQFVKTRYTTNRSGNTLSNTYWLGYEASCVIVDRYLYISENGGMFFCINLDTMQLIWAQDTLDDSNSTPVFQWDGNEAYIYTAPSLHWTANMSGDGTGTGYIVIYKLNAKTGEILWEKRFDCTTYTDASGGVQASPILGKPGTELEGLIIYPIARTPDLWGGKLIAFDTKTGEIVWEKTMNNFTWSSPVAVYDQDGKAYIIICDTGCRMQLLDSNGNLLSEVKLYQGEYYGNYIIEASPVVFGNTVVVGTKGQKVYGVTIS